MTDETDISNIENQLNGICSKIDIKELMDKLYIGK
jgi:hypothetical protein